MVSTLLLLSQPYKLLKTFVTGKQRNEINEIRTTGLKHGYVNFDFDRNRILKMF